MRSRYSAYYFHLPEYIIATTHPLSTLYLKNKKRWKSTIKEFSENTVFQKLEIHDFKEETPTTATVTFTAHLSQNGHDATFTEKSHFKKVDKQWLYFSREYKI